MDVLSTLLRVAVVFALLALVLWVLKKTDAGRGRRTSAPVQVVGSTRLSKGASLTVVRIGDEQVVLGVTDSSVSVLGSGPAPEPEPVAEPVAAPAAGPDLGGALAASLTRTLGPAAGRLLGGAVSRAATSSSDVSDDAVAAALAGVRGGDVPLPRPAAHDAAALPDPVTRAALHRAVTRTRARTA